MKNINHIMMILILIPILSASNYLSSKENGRSLLISEDKSIGPEYFPINTSLKLIYNSSMGEAIADIKKNGSDYVLDLRNDKFNFTQTVYVENDSIFLTKLDQNVDVFLFISSSASITYSRPYLRFPFPLKKNDTWNWDGIEYIDERKPDTINVSGKVLGYEKLNTEAGSFDCVKFQIDIRKKKRGTHTKFYEWRTPDIGLVRLEAFIDSKGFIGTVMNVLGYDEMIFELKDII